MKILILPLLLTLLPAALLFFILKYFRRQKDFSVALKIGLGLVFIAVGLISSYYAILLSIQGMSESKIECMTGVGVFIPLGLAIYFVGVPLLLFSKKNKLWKLN
ncbi:MAG: hypothetical protein ABI267_00080 [Ginsengibacter sp.]